MGKLKDLASVKSANVSSFAYFPPDTAFDAMRILVKPALLTPQPVSIKVLDAVLRGLRRASPLGRIVIFESIATENDANKLFDELGILNIIDKEMRVTYTNNLTMREYANVLPNPFHVATLTAPEYLEDYDCVITVGSISPDADTVSGGIANLRTMFTDEVFSGSSKPSTVIDTYFTVGQHVHASVVDAGEKVYWGDNLLAVDETVFSGLGRERPDFLLQIRSVQKDLSMS